MSYCNECPNHDACDTGCVIGAARRIPTPPHRQCSNCGDWARLHLRVDTGRCYSPDRKPDSEYGNLTLDSDGCKHWKPEPEAA